MGERRKPLRWRRATYPAAGGRWDTPMSRAIWTRDHGSDLELWSNGKRLATAGPHGGQWLWSLEGGPSRWAPSREVAMAEARAAVLRGEVARG